METNYHTDLTILKSNKKKYVETAEVDTPNTNVFTAHFPGLLQALVN